MKEYKKGIPTKIDVERLDEAYGVPQEGETISFAEAAQTLNMDKRSHRFRTVFSSWRKQLFRDHNLLLIPVGEGLLKAALPHERIKWSSRKIDSGRRAIGRAIVTVYQTDQSRLSADDAETANNILALNESKMKLAAGVMPK